MTWIRLSLLSFLVLVGIQCLGIKKQRMAIIEGIASQSLSDIILLPSSPTIVSYSVPAGTSATIVNPDPERTDPRFLLSQAEIQFVTQYELGLQESRFLETDALQKAKTEFQEALEFQIPTTDDLDMYLDELELGIPHKPRILSDSEIKAQEQKIHSTIETFFLQVLAELPNRTGSELQTMLHNTNANLRLNLILKERLSVSGFSKLALDKNIEFTNYLRRRIIQEMIERGIR